MSILLEFWESIVSVVRTMEPWDLLDIGLLSCIIYYFYKLVRDSRAGQLFKGIAFLFVVYLFGKIVSLKAITYLLERLFSFGILALMIVFQPEVRRAVEKLGHSRLGLTALGVLGKPSDAAAMWADPIEELCDACVELSETCTGALIVIEQQTRLGNLVEDGGTRINADISAMLLGNLFFKNSPLHDGAIIIREGKILAGGCQLPKPVKEAGINKKLGSRHRAAIGMSENSDAIVLVVSEETGQISVAEDGVLKRNFTRDKLHQLLTARLMPSESDNKLRSLFHHKTKEAQHEKDDA